MSPEAIEADPVAYVCQVLADFGAEQYGREAVTQMTHALQCAELAQQQDGRPEIVASALLHDIGHMIDAEGRYASDENAEQDHHHEDRAALFLGRYFGPMVTEPIRLHVAAKRYLVATDPAYRDTLSAASEHSLRMQGGPMSRGEVAAFEKNPHAREAVKLRLWDDEAKRSDHAAPPLGHFEPILRRALAV
jgi:phosphonate degradation associated HDIG domain protein